MEARKWQQARVPYATTRKARRPSLPVMPIALLLVGVGGVGYTSSDMTLERFTAALPGSGCMIKGNIAFDTGERIYHVPGQAYYDATRVSMLRGERWFCSEADARRAGWRRSRV